MINNLINPFMSCGAMQDLVLFVLHYHAKKERELVKHNLPVARCSQPPQRESMEWWHSRVQSPSETQTHTAQRRPQVSRKPQQLKFIPSTSSGKTRLVRFMETIPKICRNQHGAKLHQQRHSFWRKVSFGQKTTCPLPDDLLPPTR